MSLERSKNFEYKYETPIERSKWEATAFDTELKDLK